MIQRLHIRGFRSLGEIRLDSLGQVNLLVGPGNSGKTNLLEALFLFCSNGDVSLLPKVLGFRRVDLNDELPRELAVLLDWFWASRGVDSPIDLEGRCDGEDRHVCVKKLSRTNQIPIRLPDTKNDDADLADAIATYEVQTRIGGDTLVGRLHVLPTLVKADKAAKPNVPARFISPLEQGRSRPLAATWSEVEEQKGDTDVLKLLGSLDHDIKGIRIRSDEVGRAALRLMDERLGPVPVELLGAGFSKALAIACYLSAMRDGHLLIDELDASLHIGAQGRVIRFLMEAAQARNVQIFASTHSLETVDAFLDAYTENGDLFKSRGGLHVLQVRREKEGTSVTSLDAEQATRLREEFGVDLRRST